MKGSMFDEHRDKIIEWCAKGYTLDEMVKLLGGYYSRAGLNNYIVTKNIRNLAGTSKNECNKCKFCHSYKDTYGKEYKTSRICSKSWRVIQASVRHSPKWCEKERT